MSVDSTDRATVSAAAGYQVPEGSELYRGYVITTNPPPPIPQWREHVVVYQHAGYGGPGDSRCGTAPSFEAARAAIDERIGEGFDGPAPATITVTTIPCTHCAGEGNYATEFRGCITCRECRGHGVERFELRRDGLLGSLLPSRWTAEDARHFAASIEHLEDTAAIAAIELEVAP